MEHTQQNTEHNMQMITIKSNIMDMFGGLVPEHIIYSACIRNGWNIDACIEELTKLVETHHNSAMGGANHHGAIPKTTNASPGHTPAQALNYSQSLSITSGGFKSDKPKQSPQETTLLPQIEGIIQNIKSGYKVMVIMRGPPGCGKSYLARQILERSLNSQDYSNFIFSSDDYFYDVNGVYRYNRNSLTVAHDFNLRRVVQKAVAGWSPIIVDNTMIKRWEMMPYVLHGVQNGYLIELVQPNTSWSNSAGKMAMKNQHGVPKDSIERMLHNFEPANANDLITSMRNTRYTVPLPQMRRFPPMTVEQPQTINVQKEETETGFKATDTHQEANDSESPWGEYEDLSSKNTPKPPRSNRQLQSSINNDLNPSLLSWKPYEQESNDFWGRAPDNLSPKPQRIRTTSTKDTENSLLDILKEKTSSAPVESTTDTKNSQPNELENFFSKVQKHKIGCANESKSFIMMRQIYQNKSPDDLWDLFEKCNGDVDWAINLLLQDDSCADQLTEHSQLQQFNCGCDSSGESQKQPIDLNEHQSNTTRHSPPPQQQNSVSIPKSQRQKFAKIQNPEMLEVKRAIEKQFVIPNMLKKGRGARHAPVDNDSYTVAEEQTNHDDTEFNNVISSQNDEDDADIVDDNSESDNNNELVEINLGNELVEQLSQLFENGTTIEKQSQYATNVFMPKSLANQLYVIWMESLYNQIEEKRQKTLKEDEEFARLLEDPKYANCKKTPNNFSEILDMELAWKLYKADRSNDKWKESTPQDLASHLTQMKLCELFPNVDKGTLLEVFAAHHNNFSDTVDILKNSMHSDVDSKLSLTRDTLMEEAQSENDKLSDKKRQEQATILARFPVDERRISPSDCKRIALRDFEDSRNQAVHHSQLKAECYQKAKEAIQKGNSAVAVYYSQIANLHKTKIDMYNHKAANCIMEVHDLTQNNPDFIDLHYLHVIEALECLDIFIDKHITKMKNISRSYKHIFIITGRGLHSAGGVSTIKNKVKSRLKERNLKWSEVNPGLLKVKLFSASKYSKNV